MADDPVAGIDNLINNADQQEGGEGINDPVLNSGGDTGVSGEDLGGMDQQQPQQIFDFTDVGKVYTIKKLYTMLNNISNILVHNLTVNEKIIKLYEYVRTAQEWLMLVFNNFDTYKNRIDAILTNLYNFCIEVLDRYISIVEKSDVVDEDDLEVAKKYLDELKHRRPTKKKLEKETKDMKEEEQKEQEENQNNNENNQDNKEDQNNNSSNSEKESDEGNEDVKSTKEIVK